MLANVLSAPVLADLGDDLVVRRATPDDIEAVIDFNTRCFDERVTQWTRDLISGEHPTVQPDDFTLVENTRTQQIVSSMCAISQMWSYGGISVPVARPELVATDPAYRRRGLIRHQFEAMHARSAAKGELLQVITGVDWFYRQFGYEMGVKLWGSRGVAAAHLGPVQEPETCRLRPVADPDRAFVRDLYAHAARRHLYAAVRSPDEWDYEFSGRSERNTRRREWVIVESADGEELGYVQYLPCLASSQWRMFRIYQVELKPGASYLNLSSSLLRALWRHGEALRSSGALACDELQGLELALESEHPLFHAAPPEWLHEIKTSPWYLRVPDRAAFLRRVRDALERHLIGTVAEGFTGELKLNFCRRGLRLELVRGVITAIEDWKPRELSEGNARFPEPLFDHLLYGWRRVGELIENFPDCRADHAAEVLLDCLFPPFHGKVWVLA